jgi:hypothetical protein
VPLLLLLGQLAQQQMQALAQHKRSSTSSVEPHQQLRSSQQDLVELAWMVVVPAQRL